MRPGIERLLELLRGRGSVDDASEREWLTVLEVAEQENVLHVAAARLHHAVGASMPLLTERLQTIERNAKVSAFLWTSTLKSTLAEFHGRGIPVIALKGPWMAERLYGDAALRSYADLDLLVRRSDLARAEELLTELGYGATGRRDDYERPWQRDGIRIELHHDVENRLAFDFGVEAAWGRAQRLEYQGAPAWLLCPSDELLFLCLHGARHHFERLSHVLDLVRAWEHLPVPATAGRGRASQIDNVLALSAMMAVRMDPSLAIPGEVFERVRKRKVLEGLAEQIWEEKMAGPAPVVDWRRKHDFLLKIEPPGWERFASRLRHLRILLTRVIDDDFAFAARFRLHRGWQVWMLRPIRLVLKSCSHISRGPDAGNVTRRSGRLGCSDGPAGGAV